MFGAMADPPEKDVSDFYFKQLRKIKIGDVTQAGCCSLICTSNEYGWTFVGCNKGVFAFKTSVLHVVDKDETLGAQKNTGDATHLRPILIPTPAPVLDVSLSSDSFTLCACVKDQYLVCLFFDTRGISKQQVAPFCSLTPITDPAVGALSVQWNMGCAEELALSLSNGTLLLLTVARDVNISCKKEKMNASVVCWSPKGKQLAVGLKDGKVLQLSKTLDVKKSYPCPEELSEPHQVSGLCWLSTHLFAVVYTTLAPPSPGGMSPAPSLMLLTAPNETSYTFTNFQDVYYGTGGNHDNFFFTYISSWNVLVSSSANAMEAAVIAQGQDLEWEKWNLEGTGRAEFPLDGSTDTYAAGMTIDLTSQEPLVLNDTDTLPPSPILLLYSDHGMLCPYTLVNLSCPQETYQMVKPPKALPDQPVRLGVQATGTKPTPTGGSTAAAPIAVPSLGGTSKPAAPPLLTGPIMSTAPFGTQGGIAPQPLGGGGAKPVTMATTTAPPLFGGLQLGGGGGLTFPSTTPGFNVGVVPPTTPVGPSSLTVSTTTPLASTAAAVPVTSQQLGGAGKRTTSGMRLGTANEPSFGFSASALLGGPGGSGGPLQGVPSGNGGGQLAWGGGGQPLGGPPASNTLPQLGGPFQGFKMATTSGPQSSLPPSMNQQVVVDKGKAVGPAQSTANVPSSSGSVVTSAPLPGTTTVPPLLGGGAKPVTTATTAAPLLGGGGAKPVTTATTAAPLVLGGVKPAVTQTTTPLTMGGSSAQLSSSSLSSLSGRPNVQPLPSVLGPGLGSPSGLVSSSLSTQSGLGPGMGTQRGLGLGTASSSGLGTQSLGAAGSSGLFSLSQSSTGTQKAGLATPTTSTASAQPFSFAQTGAGGTSMPVQPGATKATNQTQSSGLPQSGPPTLSLPLNMTVLPGQQQQLNTGSSSSQPLAPGIGSLQGSRLPPSSHSGLPPSSQSGLPPSSHSGLPPSSHSGLPPSSQSGLPPSSHSGGGPLLGQQSGGVPLLQQQSGGVPLLRQQSGGGPLLQQQSGGVPLLRQQSGGGPLLQQLSGGVSLLGQQSGGGPLLGQQSGGGPLLQQQSGGGPLLRQQSGGGPLLGQQSGGVSLLQQSEGGSLLGQQSGGVSLLQQSEGGSLLGQKAPPSPTAGGDARRTIGKSQRSDSVDGRQQEEGEDLDRLERQRSMEISVQIEEFVREVAQMREGMVTATRDLSELEDLRVLIEQTQAVEDIFRKAAADVEAQSQKVSALEEEVLRGLELGEEARAELRKGTDKTYLSALKLRPLDVVNARKLQDISSRFLHVEQCTREINSQLDAEMERKRDTKKRGEREPLKTPTVHEVYTALRTHHQLIRHQRESVEQVTRNMKKLRLLPQSWSSARAEGPLSPPALSPPPPPAHTLRPPSSHKRGLSLRNLSESSDEDDVVQVLGARDRPPPPSRTSLPRMKHLRDFLCSIETTPVRTVRAGPSVVSCQSTRRQAEEEEAEEDEEQSLLSTSTNGYSKSTDHVPSSGPACNHSLEMTDYSLPPILSTSIQTQTTPAVSPSPCPEEEEEPVAEEQRGSPSRDYDVILSGETISARSPEGYTHLKVTRPPSSESSRPASQRFPGALSPGSPAFGSVVSTGATVSAGTTVAVTSTSSGVTSASSGVTSTLSGVTSASSGVTSTLSGVTSAPSGVTSASSGVTSTLSGVTSAPSGVTSASSGVTSASSGVTSAPSDVTSAPSGVTSAPSGVTSAPSVASLPHSTAAPPSSTKVATTPSITPSQHPLNPLGSTGASIRPVAPVTMAPPLLGGGAGKGAIRNPTPATTSVTGLSLLGVGVGFTFSTGGLPSGGGGGGEGGGRPGTPATTLASGAPSLTGGPQLGSKPAVGLPVTTTDAPKSAPVFPSGGNGSSSAPFNFSSSAFSSPFNFNPSSKPQGTQPGMAPLTSGLMGAQQPPPADGKDKSTPLNFGSSSLPFNFNPSSKPQGTQPGMAPLMSTSGGMGAQQPPPADGKDKSTPLNFGSSSLPFNFNPSSKPQGTQPGMAPLMSTPGGMSAQQPPPADGKDKSKTMGPPPSTAKQQPPITMATVQGLGLVPSTSSSPSVAGGQPTAQLQPILTTSSGKFSPISSLLPPTGVPAGGGANGSAPSQSAVFGTQNRQPLSSLVSLSNQPKRNVPPPPPQPSAPSSNTSEANTSDDEGSQTTPHSEGRDAAEAAAESEETLLEEEVQGPLESVSSTDGGTPSATDGHKPTTAGGTSVSTTTAALVTAQSSAPPQTTSTPTMLPVVTAASAPPAPTTAATQIPNRIAPTTAAAQILNTVALTTAPSTTGVILAMGNQIPSSIAAQVPITTAAQVTAATQALPTTVPTIPTAALSAGTGSSQATHPVPPTSGTGPSNATPPSSMSGGPQATTAQLQDALALPGMGGAKDAASISSTFGFTPTTTTPATQPFPGFNLQTTKPKSGGSGPQPLTSQAKVLTSPPPLLFAPSKGAGQSQQPTKLGGDNLGEELDMEGMGMGDMDSGDETMGNPQPQSMSGGGGGGGGFSSFGLGGKPIGDVTANPFGSTLGGPQASTGPLVTGLGGGGGILKPPTGSFAGGLSTAGLGGGLFQQQQQPGGLQGAGLGLQGSGLGLQGMGLGSSKGVFGAQGQNFGSPPSFGAKPTFGSTPSFGGAPGGLGQPTVPSTPMFGGQGSGQGGGGGGLFASTASGMSSFGSLAQQQGMGFGGGQQSTGTPNQQSPQFSQRRM